MIGSLLWLIRSAAIQAVLDGTEQVTRKTLDAIPVDIASARPHPGEERPQAVTGHGSRPPPARPPPARPRPVAGGTGPLLHPAAGPRQPPAAQLPALAAAANAHKRHPRGTASRTVRAPGMGASPSTRRAAAGTRIRPPATGPCTPAMASLQVAGPRHHVRPAPDRRLAQRRPPPTPIQIWKRLVDDHDVDITYGAVAHYTVRHRPDHDRQCPYWALR